MKQIYKKNLLHTINYNTNIPIGILRGFYTLTR